MSASFAGGLHARSCFAQLNAQHTGHNRSHAAAEQSGLYFVQGWLLQPMPASGHEMVPRPYEQGCTEQNPESPRQAKHHPPVVLEPALVISAFDFFQLCPPLVLTLAESLPRTQSSRGLPGGAAGIGLPSSGAASSGGKLCGVTLAQLLIVLGNQMVRDGRPPGAAAVNLRPRRASLMRDVRQRNAV